ncbi:hypothetical protein V2J09_004565 [Rumex salicifolius]
MALLRLSFIALMTKSVSPYGVTLRFVKRSSAKALRFCNAFKMFDKRPKRKTDANSKEFRFGYHRALILFAKEYCNDQFQFQWRGVLLACVLALIAIKKRTPAYSVIALIVKNGREEEPELLLTDTLETKILHVLHTTSCLTTPRFVGMTLPISLMVLTITIVVQGVLCTWTNHLLPHSVEFGYPIKPNQGCVRDPPTWELDDPDIRHAKRIWAPIDTGAEIYVSDREEVVEWSVSKFDVILT